MTNGAAPGNQFLAEDVEVLQKLVDEYKQGEKERNDVIAALSFTIAKTAAVRGVQLSSTHLLPYLEQLDAHDSEQEGGHQHPRPDSGEQSGGDDADDGSDGRGGESPGESERGKKRSLAERMGIEYDGEGGSKHPKVDPSEYAWRARAQDFLDTIYFTPEHRRVLDQVELYSRDIKAAVSDIIVAPFVPALPYGQWKNVLLDQFVDLDSILSNSFATEPEEPQQLLLGDVGLEIKKSKVVSKITTHGQWINGFRAYEEAVNFAFEGREKELRTYWTHINDAFSSRHVSLHWHYRIINYDRAARVFVGQRRNILLSDITHFRHIQDAHLSEGGIAVTPQKSKDRGNRPQGRLGSATCRNWNFGRCQLGVECRYRHACATCGNVSHRKSECPDKQRQQA
ncbi:hypothetical protein GGX14DRAFT_625295 [Mycena pura]|uniref:C3H1-type domain-containing protein n=1 Tax=Mycena pura TaxID=153505 RepID=A0AAD6VE09_9AGAR|nr:hypothetical protein GGX14DRAFT_625295 [Mycena pura]